ncbi:MAG: hypothetical protein ACXWNQ_00190 [Anaerolineales bacterium]
MNMPKSISTWCMIVFFLLEGLVLLGVLSSLGVIAGIAALAAAVFLFLGR